MPCYRRKRFRKPMVTDADTFASAQESSVPKSTEKQTEWSMKLRKSWSSNRKSFHTHLILVIFTNFNLQFNKKISIITVQYSFRVIIYILYANLVHCLLFRIKRENAPEGS